MVTQKIKELKQKKQDLQISEEEYKRQAAEIKKDKSSPIVMIKATDDANYKNLIDALDEMQICNISKYAIVDLAEADEYPISGPVVRAFAGGASAAAVEPVEAPAEQPAAPAESAPEVFAENDFAAQLASQAARRQQRARLDLGENGSERQVIKLDEEGRRVDAAQHGRKRSAQKKHANAKRGTNGVQQAKHDNPHAQKGKGGGKAGGAKGGNANRGGKQGKRRG